MKLKNKKSFFFITAIPISIFLISISSYFSQPNHPKIHKRFSQMSFQANKKKKKNKYLRSVIALLLLGEPIVLGGGPKSLGELLIVRTSRFLAEPGKI